MWARRGRSKWSSISALILTVLIVIFLHRYGLGLESWEPANFGALAEAKVGDGELRTDVELVVASTSYEDTSWLHRFLPEWKKNIYIVDDPLVNLTLPMNKGREAMVYLTWVPDDAERR